MIDLTDPKDPLVVDAMKRYCQMCRARRGKDCKPVPIPLVGKLVHYARIDWRLAHEPR